VLLLLLLRGVVRVLALVLLLLLLLLRDGPLCRLCQRVVQEGLVIGGAKACRLQLIAAAPTAPCKSSQSTTRAERICLLLLLLCGVMASARNGLVLLGHGGVESRSRFLCDSISGLSGGREEDG